MSKRKADLSPETYQFDPAKIPEDIMNHTLYHTKKNIPKVANRQIPVHNFGNHRSLLKDKNYRSKMKERKSEEKMNKTFFNRPVHLLKEYLIRKQKNSQHPVLISNPEDPQTNETQKSVEFAKTTNDFRIKKNIRRNYGGESYPQPIRNQEEVQSRKFQTTDRDFASFNSKNLHDMSIEELQESMKWKKQFLHMLTKKYETGNQIRRSFMER